MKINYKKYLSSFKFTKKDWQTFGIDLVSFGFLLTIFTLAISWLEKTTMKVLGGQTLESLQSFLLTAPVDQVAAFDVAFKSFITTFIIGFIVLILVTFLITSYSRSLIWNKLLKEKTTFPKWNFLILVVGIISLIYLIIYVFIKSILLSMIAKITQLLYTPLTSISLNPQTIIPVISSFLNFLGILAFLLLLFSFYISYTKKQQVFRAILEGFTIIKQYIRQLTKLWLKAALLALILGFITKPLSFSSTIQFIINLTISFLFITWLRKQFLFTLNAHK